MARRHTFTSRIEQIQGALHSADPADALLRLYYGLSEGSVELFRKAFRHQLAHWISDQQERPERSSGIALAEVSSVVLDGDIPQLRALALSAHWNGMAPSAQWAVRAALSHYRAAELCPPASWWERDSAGSSQRIPDDWSNLGYWGKVFSDSPLRAGSHGALRGRVDRS